MEGGGNVGIGYPRTSSPESAVPLEPQPPRPLHLLRCPPLTYVLAGRYSTAVGSYSQDPNTPAHTPGAE